MKAIKISDELFDRLKNCVLDPFDDTPENVISRLVDIVDKAKSASSSWDAVEEDDKQQGKAKNRPSKQGQVWQEKVETAL